MSTGTMLFNPFTGKPRDPRDIASDPRGILVWDGEEPLLAASPQPAAQPCQGCNGSGWVGTPPMRCPFCKMHAIAAQPEQPEPGVLTAAMSPEQVARMFHECYERLAPSFGCETRKETRSFDAHSANGKLMIAVCEVVARAIETRSRND